ncbi:hypothetical protein L798_12723 [Zootermopsis nevadensis]|uniref:Uncharacterized protein n=1 Tax=Zootermopsis nevadensis TaxID=136037 RepID=A0A067RHU2_ZOONE|nr:hypothetical protein L798_12723 [Zootermopsis nevadensis]
MADVKIELRFEAAVELKFNEESDSAFCVSVGTQCDEKRDDDSIVVLKCSYSDTEDTVAAYQVDTQVVSVTTFNIALRLDVVNCYILGLEIFTAVSRKTGIFRLLYCSLRSIQ